MRISFICKNNHIKVLFEFRHTLVILEFFAKAAPRREKDVDGGFALS